MKAFLLKFLIGVLILFSFASCMQKDPSAGKNGIVQNPVYGEWQDRDQPPIRFELEQTYGSEEDGEEFMFSASHGIVGPVADSSGNIYLLDRERSKLLSFDREGNLRWQTGKEGRGPGDFLLPNGIVIRKEYLFLDNLYGTRIDQYDLKGNFITSMLLPSDGIRSAQVKGLLDNGLLVTSSPLFGAAGSRISILDVSDSLSLVNQFDVKVLQDLNISSGTSITFNISVVDSLIASGNFGKYAMKFYNMKGERVKTITRDFSKLVRPGTFNNGSVRASRLFGGLNAPIKLSQQYFITTINWPINIDNPDEYVRKSVNGSAPDVQFAFSLDLYRHDGALLYSLEKMTQPGLTIGDITYVNSKGNIYTRISEPYPQVRRYRIIIDG